MRHPSRLRAVPEAAGSPALWFVKPITGLWQLPVQDTDHMLGMGQSPSWARNNSVRLVLAYHDAKAHWYKNRLEQSGRHGWRMYGHLSRSRCLRCSINVQQLRMHIYLFILCSFCRSIDCLHFVCLVDMQENSSPHNSGVLANGMANAKTNWE
jgi:hypothetical protein